MYGEQSVVSSTPYGGTSSPIPSLGKNPILFTSHEKELGRLWPIHMISRREWNTFFRFLRIAKEKHLNPSLNLSTYLRTIFSKVKKSRVTGLGGRSPEPPMEHHPRRRMTRNWEHSRLRPRESEIAFLWRVPACTGGAGIRWSIRKGVGRRVTGWDQDNLFSSAPKW